MAMRRATFTVAADPEWQPGEPDWEAHRADLKASKMLIKRQRPNINFEIPIVRQPPPYRPGCAPSSGLVDVCLDNDAHITESQKAFIIDKVILPSEPFTEVNDPRQRRAFYIIGWPDLPGARPVVDCAKALEYVSPHAIEEWEYGDFMRREEELGKAQADAAIAAVAAAIAAEAGHQGVGPETRVLPKVKKKPGRKPKNARLPHARAPTPQLDSEQEKMLAKRKQAPSLSTPHKSRIAQLDAEIEMDLLDSMDDDEDREDGCQLESRARSEIADSLDENYGDMDLLTIDTLASVVHDSFPSNLRQDRLETVPRSIVRSLVPGSTSTHRPLITSYAQQHVSQQSSAPAISSRLLQTQRPVPNTPVPLPSRPGRTPDTKMLPSLAQTIVPSKVMLIESRAQAMEPAAHAPRSQPKTAQAPLEKVGGFTPTNGSHLVDSAFPRPSKRAAEDNNESTPFTAKGKTERIKKAPKLTQALSDPPAPKEPPLQQEYTVKRLEGDSFLHGIHWFRVRWEGDWPAEENPTWEPRENISAKLVKNYLKRKSEKNAKDEQKSTPSKDAAGIAPKSKGMQSTLKGWLSAPNYASVSDVFEGQGELDQSVGGQVEEDDGNNEYDELAAEANEFLIVDSKRSTDERAKAADQRRKSLSAHLTIDFAKP